MIFLVLTILQSTAIFVIMKLFNRFKIDNWQAISMNYIVASSFGFLIYEGDITVGGIIEKDWFEFAILLGSTFIGTFYIFAISSQKVGVALTSVASKMSVVIPVLLGLWLLPHETVTILAGIGLALALLAFYLTLGSGSNRSFPKKYVIFPLLLFLGNGINDTLMKYTEYHHVADNNDLVLFLSVIFIASLVVGLTVTLIRYFKGEFKFRFRNILAGIILGMLNFGSTYYILMSMGVFDSSVVFPVANAGVVTLSALTGFLLFKEKLKLQNWMGIGLALLAILLIALGQNVV